MSTNRMVAVAARLAFAALSLAAVFVQLFGVTIGTGFSVVSFFSYFTILSNVFASVVFIFTAVRLARGYKASESDVRIRGASVVYMVFVGLVFTTLLRDVDLGALLPWVNFVHHYLMPVVVLLDWIVWPPQRKLPSSVIPMWMIFPSAYVIYSLVRGPIANFYPYPFFDPNLQGGYGGVALYCLFMLVGFAIVSMAVRAIGNARARPID